MDEPTANLDFGNSIKVLSQIIKLKKNNRGILITSHSPQQAVTYATKILMIKDGKVYRYGNPNKVMNNRSIHELYNINEEMVKESGLKNLLVNGIRGC